MKKLKPVGSDHLENIHQLIAELELKKPFYVGNSWVAAALGQL